MSTAAVIPTYRRPDELNALLVSLFSGSRRPDCAIVVDNDPEISKSQCWPAEWPVAIVKAGLGLNLAGARNLGWKASEYDVYFFIDDDNVVDHEALATLCRAIADPMIGFAGPVIYDAKFPSQVWCAGVRRSMWSTRTRLLYRGTSNLPEAEQWETDEMPDAFVIPRAVLERVGGFDQVAFPFHYDEADIAARIRGLGFASVVVRNASVWHSGGTTADPAMELLRAYRLGGTLRPRRMAKSRVMFHKRHSHGLTKVGSLFLFIPIYAITIATRCLRLRAPLKLRAMLALNVIVGLVQGYRE
jgi:GT2 family glycosyltransferase